MGIVYLGIFSWIDTLRLGQNDAMFIVIHILSSTGHIEHSSRLLKDYSQSERPSQYTYLFYKIFQLD